MPYGRYPRYRRRAPVRAAVKPVTRRVVKKAVTQVKARRFKKAVSHVIQNNMETKRASVVIAQNGYINGGGLDNQATTSASAGYIVNNVMYSIDVLQGIASNQRIGDKISPISCSLEGFVHTNQFDSVTNINFRPFDVRIVVFKYVASRDLPVLLPMKYETSSDPPANVVIDGTPVNEMLRFSAQYRLIASRTLRLRPPDSDDLSGASGNAETRINTQTSNAPYYRKFAIKVPLPKVLRYESPTTGFPANCWFSVGAYIVDANGVPVPQAQQRARLYMRANMAYKDA